MHRPSEIFNGGILPFAMGQSFEPSDEQLVCIQAMSDAEDEFERALDQALRTERQPGDAEHILVSLLNSWRCVRRARASAGYFT